MIQGAPRHLSHDFSGEAVCFDGYDLVLTNEGRDLYRLPQFWYEKALPLPPKDTQSTALFQSREQNVAAEVETYRAAGIDIGGSHLALTRVIGKEQGSLIVPIEVSHGNAYEIRAVLTRGPEYAQVELSANDTVVGTPYDCYAAEPTAGTLVSFGTAPLNAGTNQIVFSIVGKADEATGYKIGIDSYQVLHASPLVKHYMILGPFPKTDVETIDNTLTPGSRVDLKAAYTDMHGRAIQWREATTVGDGFLNLGTNLGFESSAVGYALVYVHAPEATDSVLLLGSDDGATVWLNGSEIYRIDTNRPPIPDEDAVPCRFNAGWNEVLCKVSQEGWGWGPLLTVYGCSWGS